MTRSKLRPLDWRVYNLAASLCHLLVQKSRTDVYRYSLASTVRRLSSLEGTRETKKPPVSSRLVVTGVSLRNPVTVGLSSNYAGKGTDSGRNNVFMNDFTERIEALDPRTKPTVFRARINDTLISRLGVRFDRKFQR